jgi:hypothetical protein
MGCSHYILNKYQPITVTVICYGCGKEVNPSNPALGHETCWGGTWVENANEYSLAVNIEINNTRER